jgi:tetratricopeptide (TPR) repeat protein
MKEDIHSLAEIRDLLKSEKAEEAKRRFQAIEASDNVEYFLLKGELEQKYQNYGEAMNAFNKVLEIDPENAEAQNNLHLIQNILNFWNPDMFNP